MTTLSPAERLIVAADFEPIHPEGRKSVRAQVLALADCLKGTGVVLKVNSAVRALGYDLIDEIHARGLRVFVDLKLFDIPKTLAIDGMLLREAKPELLTVVCSAGVPAMQALKAELPDTEILGVTVLTSLKNTDSLAMFSCLTEAAVSRFGKMAKVAGINGLISSAKAVEVLRAEFGLLLSLNTPAIRPAWASVPGDDQNSDLSMTTDMAIRAGADRIVVGRPITQSANPYDATMRTIEEIASAMI